MNKTTTLFLILFLIILFIFKGDYNKLDQRNIILERKLDSLEVLITISDSIIYDIKKKNINLKAAEVSYLYSIINLRASNDSLYEYYTKVSLLRKGSKNASNQIIIENDTNKLIKKIEKYTK